MTLNSGKVIIITVWIIGTTLFLLLLNYEYDSPSVGDSIVVNNNTQPATRKNTTTGKVFKILYWMPWFGLADFHLGLGREIFKNCPHSNCFTTNDHRSLPVDQFDAILFNGPEYSVSRWGKISKRSPDQVYVYANLESPGTFPDLKGERDFFNWTMTYRLDSDLWYPYGRIVAARTGYEPPTVEQIRNRTRLIGWFVSHCEAESGRDEIAAELGKYVNVDIYGECGKLKCDTRKKEYSEKCYEYLESNYKFYLSFENSLCREYVTEKLYNALKLDVVPLVFGHADYEHFFAPPHSVINVMDYKSNISALVEYLDFLDRNPEEYLKYFEWKKQFYIDRSDEYVLCNLCKKLNEEVQHKAYDDILQWWLGDNDMCVPGLSVNDGTLVNKVT